jgi:hypothetical protein
MKIYLLTNPDFVGDNNQLIGVQLAIQANLKDQQCEFQHIKEADFDIHLLVNGDFVFVSGSHGLLLAEAIKQHNPSHQVLWSGHQYFSELSSMQHLPDIVALPETALSESQKTELMEKTKLIITAGVAHCVNDKTVEKDHAIFKEQLPPHSQFHKQVGIVLAGDAPEPDGQMKYFTENDARKQASHIATYLITHGYNQADTAIMITNGPRTGKYVPDTGIVRSPDPHRSGQIDPVSRAFIETLRELTTHSQIFFYDFQFDELKKGPSAYKPMIKQVADSQSGLWFVPSESTSMVTESSFLLEKRKCVVLYHPSSENSAHLDHATYIVNHGFASDIYNCHEESFKLPQTPTKLAATQISEAFCTLLRKGIMSNHLVSGFFGCKNQSGDPMELNVKRHFCGYF